jgi:DNA modification methylase
LTVDILIGDVRAKLRELPTAYFDTVVTSPPYWGLRDYGTPGQIGLEPTLGEHLAVMVDVFREVRRVLKQQGTLWLNYGDCYAAAPNGKSAAAYKAEGNDDRAFRDKPFSTVGAIYDPTSSVGGQRGDPKRKAVGDGVPGGRIVAVGPRYNPAYATARGEFTGTDLGENGVGTRRLDHGGRIVAGGFLKPKDLCMIPNRLAIALQDDGWWVRSEIIWHKPNPMPESVYDRPTSAHEKVWLLTKGEEYFYNHEAIREKSTGGAHARVAGQNSRELVDRTPISKKVKVPGGRDVGKGAHGTISRAGRTEATYRDLPGVTPKSAEEGSRIKSKGSFNAALSRGRTDSRNARNVWTIAPRAFREAHFATFPPALAERCIKAGAPLSVCHLCGEARLPEDCGGICAGLQRDPGRVLDPFGGAGTVALVAQRLGLDCTLIELNAEYADMALKRIEADRLPAPTCPRKVRKPPVSRETQP